MTQSMNGRPHRRPRKARERPVKITRPPLRLTPYAWAKLLYLRDLGPTEVGGFGLSSEQDLLLVEDVQLVKQLCTPMTVSFDDQSVANYFDCQVDLGHKPERFARIWIHTHPGSSPVPSSVDEETFERCFGNADWAIMLIVARGGQAYARVRFATGPGGQLTLPVRIDFQVPFPAADQATWDAEYQKMVAMEAERISSGSLFRPLESLLDWPSPYLSALGSRPRESSSEHDVFWEPTNAPF